MTFNQPIRHALIMAAGRGNRMRPLTDKIPKAMIPYKKDTLIGNNLKMLHACIEHIHVTVGYKSSILAKYLMEVGVDSVLNTEGQTNSWWIHHTLLGNLNEPVLVLTCDNITTLDIHFLQEEYYRTGALADMLIPVKPLPQIDGDYLEHEKDIVTTIQRTNPKEVYCSGIQILNPAKVVSMTQDTGDFYTIWNQLINQKQLCLSNIYPHPWFSVDTLEQLANLPSSCDI